MIIPIIKLIPEKRPRFLLRTIFSGRNIIPGAFSFTFNPSVKPSLVTKRELMGCRLIYGSSAVIEEELDNEAVTSTGFF